MKKIILALAFCLVPSLALADAPGPGDCYDKVVRVCKPKKVKVKKGPLVVIPPAPAPVCPPNVIVCNPAPSVVVTRTVTRTVVKTVPAKCSHGCKKEPAVVVGGYAALGVGVRDQYVQGNVGLQLEFPKARLGLRAFTALDKGLGLQALIYPYRSDRLKVHIIDPGVILSPGSFNLTNNTDVPRSVDLIFGAGVQVKLTCYLQLLVDWRVNIADPVKLAQENGKLYQTGPNTYRYLDAPHVIGNSFSSSQVMLGLLFHN